MATNGINMLKHGIIPTRIWPSPHGNAKRKSYMVRSTSDKQISRPFQGFCKDKLQFSRTKVYSINRHSLTLITPLGKTHRGIPYRS